MTQADLFITPPPTCGSCVVRNGHPDLELASCSVMSAKRHRDDPPCGPWFGREQLNSPLYGRKAA